MTTHTIDKVQQVWLTDGQTEQFLEMLSHLKIFYLVFAEIFANFFELLEKQNADKF